MGCDIHAVVEAQVHDRWVTVDTLSPHHGRFNKGDFSAPVALSRNYTRFAALAGVRGNGPPARGLPDDLSETAQFLVDDYGVDGHSHSWLPIEEAVKIFLDTEGWGETNEDNFAKSYPASFFFNIENESLEERDYRLVFWFDS